MAWEHKATLFHFQIVKLTYEAVQHNQSAVWRAGGGVEARGWGGG